VCGLNAILQYCGILMNYISPDHWRGQVLVEVVNGAIPSFPSMEEATLGLQPQVFHLQQSSHYVELEYPPT
jgi:hypothetical protein